MHHKAFGGRAPSKPAGSLQLSSRPLATFKGRSPEKRAREGGRGSKGGQG